MEKKKIVKDKLICIQCLKLKSVHKGTKCRAPHCKNCKAAHHIMLCELDQSKLLKTKHNEEDSDDGSKELDDEKLHDLQM